MEAGTARRPTRSGETYISRSISGLSRAASATEAGSTEPKQSALLLCPKSYCMGTSSTLSQYMGVARAVCITYAHRLP